MFFWLSPVNGLSTSWVTQIFTCLKGFLLFYIFPVETVPSQLASITKVPCLFPWYLLWEHHFLSVIGFISIDEFRQTWKLFNLHLKIDVDDESIDSLARSIDFNKDGNIDFNEFLEAFHVVHKFESSNSE